ncbi:hypothetical protein ABKV19_007157 [Rosa sericea]
MAKSLALTAITLLVFWLAMSVGTWAEESESWTGWLSKSPGFRHDNEVNQANTASGPSTQGSSQNMDFLQAVQQKLQVAFQAIQQGKKDEGQEMLKVIVTILMREKSLTIEQKAAKLTEFVKNAEKSLNPETQVIAEQFLLGAQVGFKINQQHQANTASSPSAQGSSQNTDFLLAVQQKLQVAFQAIQQGKKDEGQEMLKVIVTILMREKSLTIEQKAAKLTEFVKNAEKSLNPETQVIAEQFLLGAKVGLKINQPHPGDTASGPSAQGSSQSTDVLLAVQQKLEAAFQAIQQGQQAQGQEMLVDATVALKQEKSLTVEQKSAKLTEFVKNAEKSLNKETQEIAEQFLLGAQVGFKINQQHQANTASSPSAQGSSQNTDFLLAVQQKLQVAFQAIQQGKKDEGQEMLKVIVTILMREKSLTIEQKEAKLTEFVKNAEKSLNPETQVIAEQFLLGAKVGLKINQPHPDDTTSDPPAPGSSQSTDVLLAVQQKLEAAFQAIQQGQQAQGQEMLVDATVALKQEKSLTVEQKSAKLTEFVKNAEKSLNKETQEIAEQFLLGAQVGFKINQQHQANTASSPSTQGSSQNTIFLQAVQQKLHVAFQAIQQGKKDEGQEMLKVIVTILMREKSLTIEQKAAKLTEFVKNAEKSLNPETQVIAEQFLLGAKVGLKINQPHQDDTTSDPSAPRSSQSTDVLLAAQQKLEAAFQAIQQGQQAQGQEMLVDATVDLKQEKSLTVEQKAAKLTEFVKNAEKSLNKETQEIAEKFLEGAQVGFKINQQHKP